MKDKDCVEFLQWALPQLPLSWHGFQRVRGQVCKRVQQRLRELELPDIFAYRRYLEEHTDEWTTFDRCCRITISRFYRDRSLFDCLRQQVLPILAQQVREQVNLDLECWVRLWGRSLYTEHPLEIRHPASVSRFFASYRGN